MKLQSVPAKGSIVLHNILLFCCPGNVLCFDCVRTVTGTFDGDQKVQQWFKAAVCACKKIRCTLCHYSFVIERCSDCDGTRYRTGVGTVSYVR